MASLIDNPGAEWNDNEVYEIASTDPVEGAATGASFGGVGISNQPHQQLANRTAYLKGRQDTNITNIGVLQAFQTAFKSLLGPNGYVKIPFADVNLGAVVAIVQWGFVSWLGLTGPQIRNKAFPVTFPIAFPNAGLQVWPQLQTNSFSGAGALNMAALALESGAYTKTGCNFFADWNDQTGSVISVATTINDGNGFTGFNWIAIGY